METGVGTATWASSAAMWTTFAGLVTEAMAVMAAELGTITANWHGVAPAKLSAAMAPFLGWLGQMNAVAAANALSCLGVAEAFAVANGGLIPVPAVNANRVSEMIAEATNFFNINGGLILFLNQQYGQYWAQNATTMLTYDQAVQLATIPKPSTPPPPLADAAGATDMVAEAASLASSSVTDPILSGMQQAGQAPQSAATAGQAPADMAQSMMGMAPQLLSAPTEALGKLGGQGGGSPLPFESLLSPFQSLFSDLGGSTTNSEAFGGAGPLSTAFVNPAGPAGMNGTPVTAGGGGAALGGGLGGSMLGPHGAYGSNAMNPGVKSQQVFSGVPTSRSEPAVLVGNGPIGGAGGGMPMMPGAGAAAAANANNSGTHRRDGDLIVALNPVGGTPPDRRV